jgi:hypothetical protein
MLQRACRPTATVSPNTFLFPYSSFYSIFLARGENAFMTLINFLGTFSSLVSTLILWQTGRWTQLGRLSCGQDLLWNKLWRRHLLVILFPVITALSCPFPFFFGITGYVFGVITTLCKGI